MTSRPDQPAEVEHNATVVYSPKYGYQARCSCTWHGGWHRGATAGSDAGEDADQHDLILRSSTIRTGPSDGPRIEVVWGDPSVRSYGQHGELLGFGWDGPNPQPPNVTATQRDKGGGVPPACADRPPDCEVPRCPRG